MRRPALVVVCLFAVVTGYAQISPKLVADVNKSKNALVLRKLEVEVRVIGLIAETEMTMTFYNPHNRTLSGQLYFPVPAGAAVSGYALDVRGRMVDGVTVEKQKARIVYEEETRRVRHRVIDPGTVEWTQGNVFKTRVYPIFAKGKRIVRVSYVSEVMGSTYRLPLDFDDRADLKLRLRVLRSKTPPAAVHYGKRRLKFLAWQKGFKADLTIVQADLTEDLEFPIPHIWQTTPLLVERALDGNHYFLIQDTPAPPPAPRPKPVRNLLVLWDASHSRGQTDHGRELDVLRELLADKSIRVRVVVFRDRAESAKEFMVRGNSGALLKWLASQPYDGATQLGSIPPPAGGKEPDCCLLFSDGMTNIGSRDLADFGAPVFIFSQDRKTDRVKLQDLALGSGGAYFNLLETRPAIAAAAIGEAVPYFVPNTDDNTVETYPQVCRQVTGKHFLIVGRLRRNEGRVTWHYATGRSQSKPKATVVTRADVLASDLIRRYWAQRKLEHLLSSPSRHRREIVELGRDHGLVTPYTSLIVLELMSQYVEHKIRPPACLPRMRREYDLREGGVTEMAYRQRQKRSLFDVAVAARLRQEWWKKKIRVPEGFEYPKEAWLKYVKPENGLAAVHQHARRGDYGKALVKLLILEDLMADGDPNRRKCERARREYERRFARQELQRAQSLMTTLEPVAAEECLNNVMRYDTRFAPAAIKLRSRLPNVRRARALQLLATARAHAAAGRTRAAEQSLRLARQLEPGLSNGGAARAIDRRRRSKAESLVAQAIDLIRDGQYAEGRERMRHALDLDPRVKKDLARVEQELADSRRRHGKEILGRAQRQMVDGSYDDAFVELQALQRLFPEFQSEAATQLRQLQRLRRKYQARVAAMKPDEREAEERQRDEAAEKKAARRAKATEIAFLRILVRQLQAVVNDLPYAAPPAALEDKDMELTLLRVQIKTLEEKLAKSTDELERANEEVARHLLKIDSLKKLNEGLNIRSAKLMGALSSMKGSAMSPGHVHRGYPAVGYRSTPVEMTKHPPNASLGSIGTPAAVIKPKAWDPQQAYLDRLQEVPASMAYAIYLRQKEVYANSPSYYLDCADHFFRVGREDLGRRILTTLAELETENCAILRVLAYRLLGVGEYDLAVSVFREVNRIRPEEPQSSRDLALALVLHLESRRREGLQQLGRTAVFSDRELAAEYGKVRNRLGIHSAYREASQLLTHVVRTEWRRSKGIEPIALTELNNLWLRHSWSEDFPLPDQLQCHLPVDLRVVVGWCTDDTNVSVSIEEPSGQTVSQPDHPSLLGGVIRKAANSMGPVEYSIRNARRGTYRIRVNYDANRSREMLGPVTAYVWVFTNYGRENQTSRIIVRRLTQPGDRVDVAEVTM